MTAKAGAPSAITYSWKAIIWSAIENEVKRLQLRIAKAIKIGRHGRAKALQWLLTHSFAAKLLAVRRVTQNAGKRTPGVDGVIWKTDKQKMDAAIALKRKGYRAQPLRRLYIPKKNGKERPLGIPTKPDRAQQALHLLGLIPIAEIQADTNSYGFRPKRSTHDAIAQCFTVLSQEKAAQWVLEGDIKACFDKISHEWLEKHIPMDKLILKQWLKAGYIEKEILNATEDGTPQGGLASPTLANMVLDGLETTIQNIAKTGEKIHFVRYADDFICTATSRETLETKIQPAIIDFLKERGLELSLEKTKITHINEGFDFLGFNIRKYENKLLIKPSAASIKKFSESLRETIKKMRSHPTVRLISTLNSKIRGWANYYRSCVAKEIFNDIDKVVFDSIWSMLKRKHPNKNTSWIQSKYFTRIGQRKWCFSCKVVTKQGKKLYTLIKAADIRIKRHIKIKGRATPFDEDFNEYFVIREDMLKRERFKCRIVNNNFKGA
ncbi:MAG: group II intron reverse transcriptase/maturase [Leuconostoc mesenteroides]